MESTLTTLQINFSIMMQAHKALASMLASGHDTTTDPRRIYWRTSVDYNHSCPTEYPPIELRDCQDEGPASQPPSFAEYGRELRDFQMRSLAWMIYREEDHDHTWHEQEIIEAPIRPMSLRLEVKATRKRSIMGGVLADDVGYGKTALVVALIDHSFQVMPAPSSTPFKQGVDDIISLKATLILVPTSLTGQWDAEIKKFVGKKYKVLELTKRNFVTKCSVSTLQEVDVILASWNLFNDVYFKQLARMSRAPHTPVSAGRGFEEWFEMAKMDLKTLVRNSWGPQPERLSPAWHEIEKSKYKNFVGLSQRNKNGSTSSSSSAQSRPTKRPQRESTDIDEIEIPLPTESFLPLRACNFYSLVVDEFTHVKQRQLPAILALQAPRRWILSGTPSHTIFQGVCGMAKLLGTSIGASDDAESQYQNIKGTKAIDVSRAEEVRSYTTSHTPEWHLAR